MDETRLDKIEIKELEVFANHGVYPEENVLGQKFVISATLFTRTRLAGLTDELSASINYGEVSHMITDFTRKHTYKLLESLAENLAEMLLCSLSGLGTGWSSFENCICGNYTEMAYCLHCFWL